MKNFNYIRRCLESSKNLSFLLVKLNVTQLIYSTSSRPTLLRRLTTQGAISARNIYEKIIKQ